MYPGGHVLIGIALRTTVIYAVVLLGMRLSGKREVGQMLNYVIAELSGGNRRYRKLFQGQPSLLVHDGEIIAAHMPREHVSLDDCLRLCGNMGSRG